MPAQYDEEPGHEAFADDFQQAMTYFTKLSLTGGEVCPRQHSHGRHLAEGTHMQGILLRECRCMLACSGSLIQAFNPYHRQ